MDVLCTDKTGTLPEAKIKLARQVTLSGADSERVLDLAWLNSHFQAGLRNPLDAAILESGPPRDTGCDKLDEAPFDFQRRRVSVLVEREGRRLLITKGAPEDVIRAPPDMNFVDPPKASAGAAIAALGSKGVSVKSLTGDNEHVTQHVCSELGIPITGLLTGSEVVALTDEALAARQEETKMFCRVTPVQKNRIILGLERYPNGLNRSGD